MGHTDRCSTGRYRCIVGRSDTSTISSKGRDATLFEMFVQGDAEVILRRISSVQVVQRYKAVGSKEQQENQDGMLSSNADEDKYPTFLLIWQRPERSLKGDSMPTRGVIQ